MATTWVLNRSTELICIFRSPLTTNTSFCCKVRSLNCDWKLGSRTMLTYCRVIWSLALAKYLKTSLAWVKLGSLAAELPVPPATKLASSLST